LLYSPAVCETCGAVFGSNEVIAEQPEDPTSYRRSAGPCPRCGGRGIIPEWVFRFHNTVQASLAQASAEEIGSLLAAVRRYAAEPARPGAQQAVTAEMVGPWHPMAPAVGHLPDDQWTAAITLLEWMFDSALADAAAAQPGSANQASSSR